ncbi:MAG: stage III sporulation protein AG [Ruminococcus sp.]|nr:stage III sporulation protein AG [Ruminococcus sp.]
MKRVKRLLSKEQRYKLVIFIGLLGIALIFISDIISDTDKDVSSDIGTVQSSEDPDEYSADIENRLEKVLATVSGVGQCDVMVTVSSTTEYIYAENVTGSTDNNGEDNEQSYKKEIVFIEQNGEKEALVRKTVRPQISGVMIVCEGGGDVKVKERVIRAVSTLLGVSSDKICVEGRNIY